MATQSSRTTALAMSTLAFTVCFAVWTIFSIIGIQIKKDLGLTDTQFGLLVATPIGEVTAIAEHRGWHARGCRLDVGLLTELTEAVLTSVRCGSPRLLVINTARNLDRWRAFTGALAVELPANDAAVGGWLAGQGLGTGLSAPKREVAGPWTM